MYTSPMKELSDPSGFVTRRIRNWYFCGPDTPKLNGARSYLRAHVKEDGDEPYLRRRRTSAATPRPRAAMVAGSGTTRMLST